VGSNAHKLGVTVSMATPPCPCRTSCRIGAWKPRGCCGGASEGPRAWLGVWLLGGHWRVGALASPPSPSWRWCPFLRPFFLGVLWGRGAFAALLHPTPPGCTGWCSPSVVCWGSPPSGAPIPHNTSRWERRSLSTTKKNICK
jgi:hypothetical protein